MLFVALCPYMLYRCCSCCRFPFAGSGSVVRKEMIEKGVSNGYPLARMLPGRHKKTWAIVFEYVLLNQTPKVGPLFLL